MSREVLFMLGVMIGAPIGLLAGNIAGTRIFLWIERRGWFDRK